MATVKKLHSGPRATRPKNPNPKLPSFLASLTLMVQGHSYMVDAATPGVTADRHAITNRLERLLGITTPLVPAAASGSQLALNSDTAGVNAVVQGHYALEAAAARVDGPDVPMCDGSIINTGINDAILYTGPDSSMAKAFPEALRSVIASSCSSRFFVYDDASITYVGGTAQVITTNNKGTGVRFWTANSQHASIAVPADFEDNGVIQLWFVGRASGNGGTHVISVDGVEVDQVSTVNRSVTGTTVVMVRRYQIAEGGAHTIEIRQSGTPTNGNYFSGWAIEAVNPGPPVVVCNIARLVEYSGAWAGIDDARVKEMNGLIDNIVSEFGPNVVLLDQDSILDKNPLYFDTDNTHPNDRGAALVAEAIVESLAEATYPGASANGYVL